MIRNNCTDKNMLIKIIELMVNNNKHNKFLKVMISIGIQLCYYGINWHIMLIPVTFWIKSRLIIIDKEMNKIIKLQRKITIKWKHINQYQIISKTTLFCTFNKQI